MEKVEAVAGLHRSQPYSSVAGLLLSRRPERVLEKRIPHAEGVKAQGAAVCRTFAMLQGEVNLSKKVWEKLIQLIETFSDTRIGLLRAARRTPATDETNGNGSGAKSGSDFCGAQVCFRLALSSQYRLKPLLRKERHGNL